MQIFRENPIVFLLTQKYPTIQFDDIHIFWFIFILPMSNSKKKHTHTYVQKIILRWFAVQLIVVRSCLMLIVESDEFYSNEKRAEKQICIDSCCAVIL